MKRTGKENPANNNPTRRAYEPPRLREYGSLARIVQAKPGASHDSLTCGNTKTVP